MFHVAISALLLLKLSYFSDYQAGGRSGFPRRRDCGEQRAVVVRHYFQKQQHSPLPAYPRIGNWIHSIPIHQSIYRHQFWPTVVVFERLHFCPEWFASIIVAPSTLIWLMADVRGGKLCSSTLRFLRQSVFGNSVYFSWSSAIVCW